MSAAAAIPAFAAEAADPFVLDRRAEDQLLARSPWRRFAVLGDGVAEGIGEACPGYWAGPWAARLSRALARARPELEHLNLGRRGQRASEVRERQLDEALALAPDLAAVACGGHDALDPGFDPDATAAEVDAIVASLADAGADVMTFTLFDPGLARPGPARWPPERARRLVELHARVRELSARRGAILVEADRHPASAELGVYGASLRRLSSRGHAILASLAVRRLGTVLA